MKKFLALMLVLCLALASMPVLAETATDFSGTWYLIIADITCGSFELNADGTCAAAFVASGEEKKLDGTWSAEEKAVTLTIGNDPLTLAFDGTDLLPDTGETAADKAAGAILKFSRQSGAVTVDELEAFSTSGKIPEGKTKEEMEVVEATIALIFLAAVNEAVVEDTYSGTWYLVLAGVTCGTFELNADRTCTLTTTVSGQEKTLSGSWDAEDEAVALTFEGKSLLLGFDGKDLVIYAAGDTSSLASILKFTREPGVTAEELNAYSSAGTVPEGKTKEELELAQEKLATLIFVAALIN